MVQSITPKESNVTGNASNLSIVIISCSTYFAFENLWDCFKQLLKLKIYYSLHHFSLTKYLSNRLWVTLLQLKAKRALREKEEEISADGQRRGANPARKTKVKTKRRKNNIYNVFKHSKMLLGVRYNKSKNNRNVTSRPNQVYVSS